MNHLLTTGVIALTSLAFCGSCSTPERLHPLKVQSGVGAKVRTAASTIRNSPILDDLDSSVLDELRGTMQAERDEAREPMSPALSIGGAERTDLQFRGASLGDVVASLADLSGANIVFDPGLAQPVHASFPSVTVGEALFAILDQHELELVESPPGVFVVRDSIADGGLTRTFRLSALRADEVLATVQGVAGESSNVVADAAQNLLFVRGSRATMEAVSSFLQQADQLEKQVLIEVHILEALVDEDFELGVAHAINGSVDGEAFSIAQNLATDGAGAFNTVLNFDGGNVATTINALQSYIDLELISAPRVLTVSGNEAKIEVIEEVPYIQATTSTATDAGTAQTTIQQVEFKDAGVKVDVTPTIQGGGILKIDIAKELSEVVSTFMGIPVVDRRTINSQFLVHDRQTIVLGGLMQDRRSDSESGVPILKDVPLLGRLFRSDVDVTQKRELLIFVTPRVVDPQEAAALARLYQDHYERKRTEMTFDRETR